MSRRDEFRNRDTSKTPAAGGRRHETLLPRRREKLMQDHSHKLLFMAATGAMCAAVLYGSNAVTALPLAQQPVTAVNGIPGTTPSGLPDNAGTSFLPDKAGASVLPEKAGSSVLPNSASCPPAGALAAPSPVDKATVGAPGRSAQARANASLGTGSACPQVRADAANSGAFGLPGLTPGQPQGNTTTVRP
jgi:hypothetical protein